MLTSLHPVEIPGRRGRNNFRTPKSNSSTPARPTEKYRTFSRFRTPSADKHLFRSNDLELKNLDLAEITNLFRKITRMVSLKSLIRDLLKLHKDFRRRKSGLGN